MSKYTYPASDVVARHDVDGQHIVWWFRSDKVHRIVYGKDEVKTHDDVHAAECFGYAVRHQIECAGRLDEQSRTG